LRIGNLPNHCLLAYYESRRRWIFGGSGLTIRGLAVEGVNNDGTNSHYYDANHGLMDESLLSVAGVGASGLNKTDVSKMGDFKERLLFSRKPIDMDAMIRQVQQLQLLLMVHLCGPWMMMLCLSTFLI